MADITFTDQSGTAGVWGGYVSNDWNTAGNWADGAVPTNAVDVLIEGICDNYPVINGASTCRNLTLETDATLTITGGTLSVNGNFTNNGGTFSSGSGVLAMAGAISPVTIGGSTNTTFFNLTINKSDNTRSVTPIRTLTVSNNLVLTQGILDSNGNGIDVDVTLQIDSVLTLDDGDTISMGNGAAFTLNAGGTVNLDETLGTGVTITGSNPGVDRYACDLDGTINAIDFTFASMDANGVVY